MRLLACALVWLLPATAAAEGAFLATEIAGAGVARSGHVDARLGEEVRVHLVVPVRDGRRTRYLTSAPALTLGRKRIPAADLVRPTGATAGTVRWWRIEPRMFHVDTPSPNEHSPAYSNAVLFGPSHGRWRGIDPIEYFETPIGSAGGFVLVLGNARPSDPRFDIHGGLGVTRVRAAVVVNGRALATPGLETVEPVGIGDSVVRITYRSGDGFLGWLTTFHNVPNVFGSAGRGIRHQTARYVGTDCADVMVGALRRATGRPIEFTSVGGLAHLTSTVLDGRLEEDGVTDPDGRPLRARFGETVRPGDIVLIDYGTPQIPRPWAHVGALWADRAPRDAAGGGAGDGFLGPEDLVAHTAFIHGLAVQPLGSQAPARIRVVRWKPALWRAIGQRLARTGSRSSGGI